MSYKFTKCEKAPMGCTCLRIEWIKISTEETTGYLLNLGERTGVSRARRLNTAALHNPMGLTVLSRD